MVAYTRSAELIEWAQQNLEKNAFIVRINAIEYFPSFVCCTSILHETAGLSPNGIFFILHGVSLILQYITIRFLIATISCSSASYSTE